MCQLFLPSTASFIAALLFAVHPIHTEAVSVCTFSCLKIINKRHCLIMAKIFLMSSIGHNLCAKTNDIFKCYYYLCGYSS